VHPWVGDTHARTHVRTNARRKAVLCQWLSFKLSPAMHAAHSTSRRLVPCVTNEWEREDYREGYGWGNAGTLPLYHLEMASAKDLVSCKLMFVLRKHVFWVVSPCGWLMASRHFEGTYHLHLQVYESVKFNNNNNNNNNNKW